MAFGSGFMTNATNLSKRKEKTAYFNFFDKDRKYTNDKDALILKEASAETIENNRNKLRRDIFRTNLVRFTVTIVTIFLVTLVLIYIS